MLSRRKLILGAPLLPTPKLQFGCQRAGAARAQIRKAGVGFLGVQTDPNFGAYNAAFKPRNIQLSLRLMF